MLKHPAIWLVRAYRVTLSPALAMLGVRCRHEPSCSAYAIEAIGRHGLWAGGWMTLARLQRCHPWGSHGFDPPPERLKAVAPWTPWRYGDWRWRAFGAHSAAACRHSAPTTASEGAGRDKDKDKDESHDQGHAS